MRQRKQAGFTVVEALIIIFIVGALLGVGIWVVKNQSDNKEKTTDTSQTNQGDESTEAPSAPTVENNADLTEAEKALDDSNLDAGTSDNSQLDSQTSDF